MKRIGLVVLVGLMLCLGTTLFAGLEEADDLYNQGKYAEALAEYQNALPTLSGEDASLTQFHIGCCLEAQKKYDEAILEYQKVSAIPNANPYYISNAQWHIGYLLEAQGKSDEAQQYYLAICRQEGTSLYLYKLAFSKINKTKLGRDGYIKLLQDMIFIIPATQENAEFLGILKSELKKLGVE